MRRNVYTRSGTRPRPAKKKKKRPHTSYTPIRRTPRSTSKIQGVSSVQELTRRQHQFASMHKKRVRQHTTCFLPKNFIDTRRLPPDLNMSVSFSGNQTGSSTRHGRCVDAFLKVHEKMVDPDIHDNIKAKYFEDLFQIAVHFSRREQRLFRELRNLKEQHEELKQEISELRDGYKSDYDLVLSHPTQSDLIKLKSSVEKLKTEIYTYKKEHMKGMEESTARKSSVGGKSKSSLRIKTKGLKKGKKRRKRKEMQRAVEGEGNFNDDEREDVGEAEDTGRYTGLIKQKFSLLEDYVVFLKKKISVLEQSDNDLKTLVGRFGSIRDLLKDNEKLRNHQKLNDWTKKRFDTNVLLNSKKIFPLNRENKKPKELLRQYSEDDELYEEGDDSTSEFDDDEDLDSDEEEDWERNSSRRKRPKTASTNYTESSIQDDELMDDDLTSVSSTTLLNRRVRRKNLHYLDVKYLKGIIFALQNELFYYKDLSERLVPFNRNNQVTIVQKFPMEFDPTFPKKSPSQFTALSQLLEDPGLDLLDDQVYGENEDELQEEVKLMEKRHQSQLKEEEHLSKDFFEEQDLSTPTADNESTSVSPYHPNRSRKKPQQSIATLSELRTMRQKNLALTKVLEQRNLELVEMRRSLKHLNSQLEKRPGKFQLKELETSIRRQLMEISRLNSLLEEKEKYYIFQSRYVEQLRKERSERSLRMIEMMKQLVKHRTKIRFLNKERFSRVAGCRTLHQLLLSLLHLFFESKTDYSEIFGSFFIPPQGGVRSAASSSEAGEVEEEEDFDLGMRSRKKSIEERKFDQLMQKNQNKKKKSKKASIPTNIFEKKKKKRAAKDIQGEEKLRKARQMIEIRNEQFLNFTYTNAVKHYSKILNSVLLIQRWWRGVSTRRKLLKEGYYLIKKKKSPIGDGGSKRVQFMDEKNKTSFKLEKPKRKGKGAVEMDLLSIVSTIDDQEEEREFQKFLEEQKRSKYVLDETFRILPMMNKCHLATIGWDEKNSKLFYHKKSKDLQKYIQVLKKEMLTSIKGEVRLQLKNEWIWVSGRIKELEEKIWKKESIVSKDRKVQTDKLNKMSLGSQAGVTQIQNVNIIF